MLACESCCRRQFRHARSSSWHRGRHQHGIRRHIHCIIPEDLTRFHSCHSGSGTGKAHRCSHRLQRRSAHLQHLHRSHRNLRIIQVGLLNSLRLLFQSAHSLRSLHRCQVRLLSHHHKSVRVALVDNLVLVEDTMVLRSRPFKAK